VSRSLVYGFYGLLVLIWSSTWVAIKIGLEDTPPLFGAGIRFVLAGAGLKALGRAAEARAAFERALKMDPQNELAKTQLSELSAPARGRTGSGGGR
jgi:drug/metabolite transporter (DMT)-like permease